MSISDEVLLFLCSSPASYKKLQQSWRKDLQKDISYNTLYVTFQRLKKKGYVRKNNENWILTTEGDSYISKKLPLFKNIIIEKEQLLVLFDIPEKERFKRDWLRKQLTEYNYKKIQGSVWLGPGPFPKEFISFLKKENIYKYVLFFRTQGNIDL